MASRPLFDGMPESNRMTDPVQHHLRRQLGYLSAMNVTLWVPRGPLPGARASALDEAWPLGAVKDVKPDSRGADPVRVRPVPTELEAPCPPVRSRPAPTDSLGPWVNNPSERFELTLRAPLPEWLLVYEHQGASLSRAEARLLASIEQAIGCGGSALRHQQSLSCPPRLPGAAGLATAADTKAFLGSLLGGVAQEVGSAKLVCFGGRLAQVLSDERTSPPSLLNLGGVALHAAWAPALTEMLSDPGAKALCWMALRPLVVR